MDLINLADILKAKNHHVLLDHLFQVVVVRVIELSEQPVNVGWSVPAAVMEQID
jgi:hypothetical protein